MEIQDGSTIDYSDEDYKRPCIYSWGWIGDTISSSENTLNDEDRAELVKTLKAISKDYDNVTDHCMGHHTCEICEKDDYDFNGTVRIVYEDKVYCSPAGVHHYIEMHDYIPPQEVLNVIKEGQILNQDEWTQYNLDDSEYQEELKQRHKEFLIGQEKGKRQAKKERKCYQAEAKVRLDKINNSWNPKDYFAKRLKDLFLM